MFLKLPKESIHHFISTVYRIENIIPKIILHYDLLVSNYGVLVLNKNVY